MYMHSHVTFPSMSSTCTAQLYSLKHFHGNLLTKIHPACIFETAYPRYYYTVLYVCILHFSQIFLCLTVWTQIFHTSLKSILNKSFIENGFSCHKFYQDSPFLNHKHLKSWERLRKACMQVSPPVNVVTYTVVLKSPTSISKHSTKGQKMAVDIYSILQMNTYHPFSSKMQLIFLPELALELAPNLPLPPKLSHSFLLYQVQTELLWHVQCFPR